MTDSHLSDHPKEINTTPMFYILRLCYRQAVTYRKTVISSLVAITFILLVSWTEEEYLYGPRDEVPATEVLAEVPRSQGFNSGQGHSGSEERDRNNRVTGGRKTATGPQDRICPGQGQTTQVILLTYGRSGSSLTADILQKHDDVFFNYEPLHNLAKSFSPVQEQYSRLYLKYLPLVAIPDYKQQAERVIDMLLTCNYTHLPAPAYYNNHLFRSKNTRPLFFCTKRANEDKARIQECLKTNSALCLVKPLQLIKTIRLTAESVGRLMAKRPNLKMIYLMRDPRGSYVSKMKAFPHDFSKNATFEALRICPRLKKDIDDTLALYKKYPGRVHITRYETIAEDPLGTSQKLYDFLCLDFTPSIQNYIKDHVMQSNSKAEKNIYATQRRDPKAAAYLWRTKMDAGRAMTFDEHCAEVYEQLGYLPVDNEDHLRDLDTPLKVDMDALL